jgi:hypothetical protein
MMVSKSAQYMVVIVAMWRCGGVGLVVGGLVVWWFDDVVWRCDVVM